MLNDILVHLPVDRSADSVIESAISIGQLFDAHLDGIACAYQPINPSIVVGASAAYFAEATQYNTDLDQAARRLDQFEIAVRQTGLSHGGRTIADSPALANETLSEIGRLYDLNIVAQPDPSRPSHYDGLPEALLFNSGRPLLLVPYIHTGPVSPDRVLICWDASRPAARAVHDALPLLRKAQTIEIVTINEDEEAPGRRLLRQIDRASGAPRPRRHRQQIRLRAWRDPQRDPVAGSGYQRRSDGNGRLWPFPAARVHTRRGDPRDVQVTHRADADGALKRPAWSRSAAASEQPRG